MGQKSEAFHIGRLYYVVSNARKILGTGVKLGASGRPKHGLKCQDANKLSPEKRMMPLSYDPEIFPKYLAHKPKLRPQISAS